ncbi:IS21 family transposase, partial [Vibrio parahaemolyticus]|nr:IS21 family transposase [Vibrio parahaemolyticus]
SCLKLGPSTISELLTRFKQSQLGWPLPESCSDADITQALYHGKKASRDKVMPDFTQYAVELRRKGMTKMLLWQEYHEQYQEQSYAYTQFCEHFTRWFKTQKRSMRQLHVAGDKLFIDYCGPRLQVVNPDTGEVREAEVFVATLGASNYTYVEAFPSQGKSYWLEAHANAFEHFGGVPHLLVPDNLRSAVSKANRYEPRLNDSYQKLANHYQTAVMPARPYKPKDKAKAENAVLLVERWIMMRLRHQTFYTFK